MPRKKKTRQQKIIASLRRQVAQQPTASLRPDNKAQQQHMPQYSLERITAIQPVATKPETTTHLLYVKTSLRKTAVVSCVILLFECFLLLLFKSHIVRLPMLRY